MALIKIWERYFFREVIRSCLFFLACFYGIYVLIDYASHTASFHRNHVQFQWLETSLYYACEFALRLELLLPFALTLATIRTLCALNSHNELVALRSSGISLQTLMRPFLIVGLAGVALMYLNMEFILPFAANKLKHIEDNRNRNKEKRDSQFSAQHVLLEDNSTILFHSYDSVKNVFFDAYWIRNVDDIYRIKYLSPSTPPRGRFVDRLRRNQQGQLLVVESFKDTLFPDMRFDDKLLFETITPPEELSLSELREKLPDGEVSNEKESQMLAAYYRKLAMPWLCLLAVIGSAPFCVRSTRGLPTFFIYAGSLFGLIAFYLILSAAVLLGKRQVFEPFWVIWTPFTLFAAFLSCRYSITR